MRLDGRRVGNPELDLWAALPAGIAVRLVLLMAARGNLRFAQ